MRIGIDVGSTTLKCVVLDDSDRILFKSYERHFSKIKEMTVSLLNQIKSMFPAEQNMDICVSGSAGMGLATSLNIPFVQEVYATRIAVNSLVENADVVIELGGEDAKILFLSDSMEVRMNGSCAGGTGAFIDQMATLLSITPDQMNELAKSYTEIYSIASRCGVFAKSDIQPLLNQGAQKNDVSASIFYAVVNQTIAGLAQGREIKGKIVYLGGPLTFLSELRKSFDHVLNTTGIRPENSLYFVALGAAYSQNRTSFNIDTLIELIKNYNSKGEYAKSKPLFQSNDEFESFKKRHASHNVPIIDDSSYSGGVYVGIDAGSTTVKVAVIDEKENLLFTKYTSNSGNPVPIIKETLMEFYQTHKDAHVLGGAVTGYGEDIIKNAFCLDFGIVETVAHFTAAKKFQSNVDFIIDIGGQDIKCFKIRNGVIDNIFLNEACSSGCGSFLQTFAGALNYTVDEFGKLGLFADSPVDLGSRCTVFMNSSVKQAQKDGATIQNISAGLSVSVVKNALYKVIRATSADALGENIVVQGGTFLNDAVLRAFEMEIGHDVIRPQIAGLMGAYGAALYAMGNSNGKSDILNLQQLNEFNHKVQTVTCNKCSNHCSLTVNTFDGARKFIGGNRCEKPITNLTAVNQLNIYEYKRSILASYLPVKGTRGKIGIPMGLNMYELFPFWHRFFTTLGFEVITSPASNREIYLSGQHTIPSDTVCFPAKLMHGHIEYLLNLGVDAIFYPCMTYNLDEGLGDNHYNCPVVAYYPEVLAANVSAMKNTAFIYDYIGIHRRKDFTNKIKSILEKYFGAFTKSEITSAVNNGYAGYYSYLEKIRLKGQSIIDEATAKSIPIIILSGRPYHIDPEINHSIDKLVCSCNAAVISEDCVSQHLEKFPVSVLNQWTYHSRLYAAARYIADKPNMNLVQLVSFGCGVDAITTDEVRSILEKEGKIYTQIKIDEITNLGAVKIRLRSLFAAIN